MDAYERVEKLREDVKKLGCDEPTDEMIRDVICEAVSDSENKCLWFLEEIGSPNEAKRLKVHLEKDLEDEEE